MYCRACANEAPPDILEQIKDHEAFWCSAKFCWEAANEDFGGFCPQHLADETSRGTKTPLLSRDRVLTLASSKPTTPREAEVPGQASSGSGGQTPLAVPERRARSRSPPSVASWASSPSLPSFHEDIEDWLARMNDDALDALALKSMREVLRRRKRGERASVP